MKWNLPYFFHGQFQIFFNIFTYFFLHFQQFMFQEIYLFIYSKKFI